MEKIKINEREYELVADGYQLKQDGGCLIFRPGAVSFEEAEADLKAAKVLTMLDDTGNPILSRSDLVYAGRLSKDNNYVIGTDQVQTSEDAEGNPLYETQDIAGAVLIADFRLPNLREAYAKLQEELTSTQMALVELYEGGGAV